MCIITDVKKYEFRWNSWNLQHIAVHGVGSHEVEYVVRHARRPYPRYEGDDKFIVRGQSLDGTYLQVVYLFRPVEVVYVIHARPLIRERESRRYSAGVLYEQKTHKSYDQMNAQELAQATKQYDAEFVGTPGKPLTPAQKAMHVAAAKRAAGRGWGRGAERINITVERSLLQRADRAASSLG